MQEWNKIAQDVRENVTLSDFYGAPAATKMVFRLMKNVCSDFSDTNCIFTS